MPDTSNAGFARSYQPTTPGDWSPVPSTIAEALDELAAAAGGGGGVEPQTVYVSASGNDTTGTGTASKPYLTIAKALSTITTATAVLPFVVHVGPGTFVDPFNIKPWCAIVGASGTGLGTGGSGPPPTEITAAADTCGFDASFGSGVPAAAWFSHLGWANRQTLDMSAHAGTQPALCYFDCEFQTDFRWLGGDNSAPAVAVLVGCIALAGNLSMVGWYGLFLRHSEAFNGISIANSAAPAGAVQSEVIMQNSIAHSVTIDDAGQAFSANGAFLNSAIQQLTHTGLLAASSWSGVGAPSAVTLNGGALPPTWPTYAPTVPADWGGITPTSLANALDRLAAFAAPPPVHTETNPGVLGPTPTITFTSAAFQLVGAGGSVRVSLRLAFGATVPGTNVTVTLERDGGGLPPQTATVTTPALGADALAHVCVTFELLDGVAPASLHTWGITATADAGNIQAQAGEAAITIEQLRG